MIGLIIVGFLMFVLGLLIGGVVVYKLLEKRYHVQKKNEVRVRHNEQMLNQWLILKENGMSLRYNTSGKEINTIIIYGMGMNGHHLVRELQNQKVRIVCAIDGKKMSPYLGVPIYTLNDSIPEADLVINTVITEHETICMELKKYVKCPIVNLENIVFDSYPKNHKEMA